MSNTKKVYKIERFNLRLNKRQKEMLVRAARVKETDVSDFIRENACKAAYEILASENHFTLPPKQWEAFNRSLDAPVKDIPSLRNLLTDPGVFDAPQ